MELELSKADSYDSVSKALAARLGLDHPLKLRLTGKGPCSLLGQGSGAAWCSGRASLSLPGPTMRRVWGPRTLKVFRPGGMAPHQTPPHDAVPLGPSPPAAQSHLTQLPRPHPMRYKQFECLQDMLKSGPFVQVSDA